MVIRPNGYAHLGEHAARASTGCSRTPGTRTPTSRCSSPRASSSKEAEHVEGFAPQLAVVTHAGRQEAGGAVRHPAHLRDDHQLACSPSGSRATATCRCCINQWANVMRWEMRTRLFLRTTEFLWQEGHTCHETEEDAEEETLRMLEVYRDVRRGLHGDAGAHRAARPRARSSPARCAPTRIEAMMQDKKALQAGTCTTWGRTSPRPSTPSSRAATGKQHYVWQTSLGRLHAAHRRADHDPLRRRGPGRAAEARRRRTW